MNNTPTVTMNVDPAVVSGIVEKKIQEAVIEALNGRDELIAKTVSIALHTKVNSEGVVDRDSYYNKNDFMDVVTQNMIREAAKTALEEWLASNKEKVRAAVIKEMKKPSRQASIAKVFADEVERAITGTFNPKFTINFEPRKD